MNKFTKISGLIGGLLIIACLLGLIFAFSEASGDEQILLMFLLIPLFFVSHFYIRFRFGFTAEAAGSRFIQKTLDVGAVLVLVLILGSGVYFITSYLLEQRHDRALAAKYSRLKVWEENTLAFKLRARLETKYDVDYVRYKLTVEADSTNRYRLQDRNVYVLNFYDKDGFLLQETRITNFTEILDDQGLVSAHVVNATAYFDIKSFAKVDSWDLALVRNSY
jgi:hypothetical protein